jgi:hypothetical protein
VIRALCDNSGATIRLSPPDHRDPMVMERIVAVSGTGPAVASAVVSMRVVFSGPVDVMEPVAKR